MTPRKKTQQRKLTWSVSAWEEGERENISVLCTCTGSQGEYVPRIHNWQATTNKSLYLFLPSLLAHPPVQLHCPTVLRLLESFGTWMWSHHGTVMVCGETSMSGNLDSGERRRETI